MRPDSLLPLLFQRTLFKRRRHRLAPLIRHPSCCGWLFGRLGESNHEATQGSRDKAVAVGDDTTTRRCAEPRSDSLSRLPAPDVSALKNRRAKIFCRDSENFFRARRFNARSHKIFRKSLLRYRSQPTVIRAMPTKLEKFKPLFNGWVARFASWLSSIQSR
jgi:hypothetical protein